MNRKAYASILGIIFLAISFLTSCSSSSSGPPPPPTIGITATSGTPQSTTVGTAFGAPLAATVTSNGSPASGVTVTFTVQPSTGASATFANGTATETDTTNSSGVATSSTPTANTTAGGPYTVLASTSGTTTTANFSLTNNAGAPATITATSGTPQSAVVSTAFTNPLVATVLDSDSNPVSGASVTFTVQPAAGASGTFVNGTGTETDLTGANGQATSSVFTANATTGAYTVTANLTPALPTPATFSLTNTAVVAVYTTYSFYLSGLEAINDGPNYYAVAGSVTVDQFGDVAGGELDYNDAFGITSPGEPGTPDVIEAEPGALVVGANGQGTLTLTTNDSLLGPPATPGVITLGLQFVNLNHALVAQFDGSATSSGSLDVQNLTTGPNGNFSFTLSGVDPDYYSVDFGGVYSLNNGAVAGVYDVNDSSQVGQPVLGTAFTGTASQPDSYGRGIVTGTNLGGYVTTLAYYDVGPEAIRIIDVDATDSAVGSAFGQGTTTFTNASLGGSVFGIQSNSWGDPLYAAAGSFTTDGKGNIPSGIGDDDEDGDVVSGIPIGGTYSISNEVGGVTYNGYSNVTLTTPLQSVSFLGIYLTDPNLNINDPNNATSGLGGALVADLDAYDGYSPNGTGVITPQTDTSPGDFTGSSATYAFGTQDYNGVGDIGWEFDFVGEGSFTAGAFAGIGLLNDVGDFFDTGIPETGVAFAGTPLADTTPPESTTGRYTLFTTNPAGPFEIAVDDTGTAPFDVVIYQASGTQLYWLNEDDFTLFLGSVEQQGSLTGLPLAKRAGAKSAKPKQ